MPSVLQHNCRNKKKIATTEKTESQTKPVLNKTLPLTEKEETNLSAPVLSKLSSIDKISHNIKEQEIVFENKLQNNLNEAGTERFKPVNTEVFMIAWQNYLENELQNKSKNLSIELKSKPPTVQEDGSVKIVFENASLQDMFQKERIAFVDFMADKHGITGLQLILEVKKAEETDKYAYMTNSKEIFEFMAIRNPNLVELQKKLNLKPI